MGICGMALTLGSVEIYRWKKYEVATILPNGYAPVEYIESSGTQYIDTGYSASGGFIGEAEFEYTSVVSNYIVGAHNLSSPYGRNGVGDASGKWQLGTGDTYPSASTSPAVNVRYSLKFSTVKGNSYLEVNGSRVISTSDSTTRSASPLLVFNNHYSLNVGGATTNGKLSLLKLYAPDNSLVRDFISCVTDGGAGGLYDKQNGAFYPNAGSGAFLVGAKTNNIAVGDFIEEVKSLNENAYPDGGVQNGYYYERVV